MSNLRKLANVNFLLLVFFILYDGYLARTSPHDALAKTGQVAKMKVRGGFVFVRPVEYYVDRSGLFGSLAICLAALAASKFGAGPTK